jgi:hypothetical protein
VTQLIPFGQIPPKIKVSDVPAKGKAFWRNLAA